MKTSFLFSKEITADSTSEFLDFLNYTNQAQFPVDFIDVYLRCPGGDLECYSAIKEAIETSEIPIRLHAVGMIASAALMLFYFTENCIKSMSGYAYGLAHLATSMLDDREMRNKNSHSNILKTDLDIANNELIELFKKHKILKTADLKRLIAGDDVVIPHNELYNVMLKCPYGDFLKEGERIILEEKVK